MNVNPYNTTDYENKSDWTLGENKPNSNPIPQRDTQYATRITKQNSGQPPISLVYFDFFVLFFLALCRTWFEELSLRGL